MVLTGAGLCGAGGRAPAAARLLPVRPSPSASTPLLITRALNLMLRLQGVVLTRPDTGLTIATTPREKYQCVSLGT